MAVLGAALLFAINPSADKTIFGFRAYQVLSGSMSPALKVGDLVVVKATPPEEIQKGDIITYYPNSSSATTVTHRVIGTFLDGNSVVLETQGDATSQPDPKIYGQSVIGVVAFHIPYLGGAIGWIQGNVILSVVIFGLALAFITSLGVLFQKNKTNKEGEEK